MYLPSNNILAVLTCMFFFFAFIYWRNKRVMSLANNLYWHPLLFSIYYFLFIMLLTIWNVPSMKCSDKK